MSSLIRLAFAITLLIAATAAADWFAFKGLLTVHWKAPGLRVTDPASGKQLHVSELNPGRDVAIDPGSENLPFQAKIVTRPTLEFQDVQLTPGENTRLHLTGYVSGPTSRIALKWALIATPLALWLLFRGRRAEQAEYHESGEQVAVRGLCNRCQRKNPRYRCERCGLWWCVSCHRSAGKERWGKGTCGNCGHNTVITV